MLSILVEFAHGAREIGSEAACLCTVVDVVEEASVTSDCVSTFTEKAHGSPEPLRRTWRRLLPVEDLFEAPEMEDGTLSRDFTASVSTGWA
jgi:hypothetical protein